jgi:hypothetical protein
MFFGKTVWRRRKEPYIFFKTHPAQKEDAPPVLFQHNDLSKAARMSVVLLSHPYINLGEECC